MAKLKELSKFVKEQGSYMAASRSTTIFWLNLRRWVTGETKPCLANQELLKSKGLYVK